VNGKVEQGKGTRSKRRERVSNPRQGEGVGIRSKRYMKTTYGREKDRDQGFPKEESRGVAC